MTLLIIPLMIGTTELLLIAGIALLLFGGKKLPEMMRGMGKGVKSFKEGLAEPSEQEMEQMRRMQEEEEQKESPQQADDTANTEAPTATIEETQHGEAR